MLLLPTYCSAQSFVGGRCLAVVVGVNRYADVRFAPLNYCGNDARLISQVLASQARVPTEQIVSLTEEESGPERRPLRENVIREVQRLSAGAEAGDTLLVFFSGHGVSDESGQVVLATTDTQKQSAASTGVAVQWLKETMERSRATRKILLLDCCHAGAARNEGNGTAAQLAPCFAHARGLVTMASCAADELSHEWPEVRQGLFTYFVGQGLKGKADLDGDRIVDVDELYKFVYDRVSTTALRIKNVQQHPQIYRGNDVSGVFAVTVLGPTTIPQTIAEEPEAMYWITADALGWWATAAPIPVTLLAASPVRAGPFESVIYGNQSQDLGLLPGTRLTLGGWIDGERKWGVELVGLLLPEQTTSFEYSPLYRRYSTYSNQVVGIPFISTSGGSDALIIQNPGGWDGGQFRAFSSLNLWSVEANALHRLTPQWNCPLILTGGVRFLSLAEELSLQSSSHASIVGTGSFTEIRDSFQTTNRVVGPQAGVQWRWRYGRITGDLSSKVALGANIQTVRVQGSSASDIWSGDQIRQAIATGGIFAQMTNMSDRSQTRFVWMPEASARVNWEVLDGIHLSIGYTVLYLSDVLRPGPQIDRVINPDQFGLAPGSFFYPEPARPGVLMRSSSILIHGLQAGFEIRF